MSEPELSIVVPAYNEATRIGLTLSRILAWARAHSRPTEILVVDDGSSDATREIVRDFEARFDEVRLLTLPVNRGKGAAVRAGVLASKGANVLFSDADLSAPIEGVDLLLTHLRQGNDVVIGSRGLPASDIRHRQSRVRENMGRTFNQIVRVLTSLPHRDTQCGFKLFTREAAHAIFSQVSVERFAFDVEVLLLAQDLGYRIREVPIVWAHAPNSHVSLVKDSTRMLRDVLSLRAKRALKKARS